MEKVIQALVNFQVDRPIMADTNTRDFFLMLGLKEVGEVYEAIEMGKSDDEVASEMADVVIFYLNALIKMGRNPEEELMTKIAANHCTHPAKNYQEGDYETQRRKSKQEAAELDVRSLFY